MSTLGSGLWSTQHAIFAHLVKGAHGLSGEIADVRRDINVTLGPLAAIAIEEFLAPPTAAAAAIQAATASVVAPTNYTVAAGQLTDVSVSLAIAARAVTLTTAGVTPANAPASALVKGFDQNGKPQTETLTPATTAATTTGVKFWSKVTEVDFGASAGTAATVSIGFGAIIGLKKTVKARTGATTAQPPIFEYMDAATATPGVINPTTNGYAPNTAPNGTHKYCVFYELDATTIPEA